jgi:hypothetical protein
MPFAHLASVANVALELPFERELDEVSARKQIERHKEKVAEENKQIERDNPIPF